MSKEFYFFLESYIYVNHKGTEMLLYDTHTGKRLLEASSEAIALVHEIYKDENLGSVEISEETLKNVKIGNFVKNVLKLQMGQLLDSTQCPEKPIVFLPILAINQDVEKFKEKKSLELLFARNIGKYLLDVNIFLNDSCPQTCLGCKGYHKQFFSCRKSDEQNVLPKELLISLFEQVKFYPIRTINVTGGNIYQYPNLDVFGYTSDSLAFNCNFFIHYLNYEENAIIDSHNIHLLVTAPVNHDKLKEVCRLTVNKNVTFHAIIECNEQYADFCTLFESLGIETFEVHPYYNTHNLQFFEDNIYLSKDDIFSKTLSMREIFRNQKVNGNSFGSLFILPDGSVKANMNEATIGNLEQNMVIDLIHQELLANTAWRVTRAESSCQSCVYHGLCPPISNYERVLANTKLCHVHP